MTSSTLLGVKKYNAKYSKTPMPTSDKGVDKPKYHPALAALQKQQNLEYKVLKSLLFQLED